MSIKYSQILKKWFVLTCSLTIVAIFVLPLNILAAEPATISISSSVASNSTVAYNTSITLTGKITPDHQGTVYIKYQKLGTTTYKTLATVTTDAAGNYSYTFNATASSNYVAAFNGDTAYAAFTSDAVLINTQAQVTLGKVTKPKYAGQRFYVTGNIAPAHNNSEVSVQMSKGSDWITISKGRTDKQGNFKIKSFLLKTGTYHLRVAFSDTDHALASSNSFDISQKWGNPWKISAGYNHYIVINKRSFKLWYLVKGKIVATFRVGVGQPSYPTPSGNFKVIAKAVRPTWYNPDASWSKDMPDQLAWPQSPLGERGLFLSASGIIIHGTTQPWLLDRPYRAISHGCIRLKNNWVIWMYNHVPVGTPVKIYG